MKIKAIEFLQTSNSAAHFQTWASSLQVWRAVPAGSGAARQHQGPRQHQECLQGAHLPWHSRLHGPHCQVQGDDQELMLWCVFQLMGWTGVSWPLHCHLLHLALTAVLSEPAPSFLKSKNVDIVDSYIALLSVCMLISGCMYPTASKKLLVLMNLSLFQSLFISFHFL